MHHNLATNMYSYRCMYVMLLHVSRPNSGTWKIIFFGNQSYQLFDPSLIDFSFISLPFKFSSWQILRDTHNIAQYTKLLLPLPTLDLAFCAVLVWIRLQDWILDRCWTATTIPHPACPLIGHKHLFQWLYWMFICWHEDVPPNSWGNKKNWLGKPRNNQLGNVQKVKFRRWSDRLLRKFHGCRSFMAIGDTGGYQSGNCRLGPCL